ncbi:MAG: bifunctional salicylyl-CoA 5-hydroxylase/oxidoreductase [Thermoanaerobaculia bacterium]|nr:bifunctional salicylyl-CoA 5-hydroxylase/oxidoreductase [Thermoanaerobaculia bacterium]
MKIVCLGGGPAGLYFSILAKKARPDWDLTVLERNAPGNTFGWGVVFSDKTMAGFEAADPETHAAITASFRHWDDIDVFFRGQKFTSGGHGFCGIARTRLLEILENRARELGVRVEHGREVADPEVLAAEHDLLVAADGVNSVTRNRWPEVFRPGIDVRKCRFVWLGTHKKLDAFTFDFRETPAGWFSLHAYRFDDERSTFIVETPEENWQRAGLDRMSQEEATGFCEQLFADRLSGERLISNAAHLRGAAIWLKFQRVLCERWHHGNVVLLGDAAHTAHFSIGSGTKLAMEDAMALAGVLIEGGAPLPALLARYQDARELEALRLQSAARNRMEWFESIERYVNLEPEQFAYALLTGSQRVGHESLQARDAGYIGEFERWFAARAGVTPRPPMFTPFTVRGLTLPNRVIVSPMATYSAVDGVPNDFHLVHLGSRALGGAAMVVTEMTCVTPEGRITPACTGLWSDEQEAAWARIVRFVHQFSGAKIALQLGHSGRKGSTRIGWEGIDLPLPDGNWPLLSASPLPYLDGLSQVPREMTRAEMETVLDAFVAATKRAARADFDWLELHAAHGYLLSSFLSPLTNVRRDDYGGSLENRCRFPLEVFTAMRAAWPAERPMSVRISAHDWVSGGNTPEEAREIARLFKLAGVDVLDCSSGQVSKAERPVYGRMFQVPFSDLIRNEVGIPTIAVGNIFEGDHVNTIIAAGRADLCALARPHLADPAWTLHEAARQGWHEMPWPSPYLGGKDQLERNLARAAQLALNV